MRNDPAKREIKGPFQERLYSVYAPYLLRFSLCPTARSSSLGLFQDSDLVLVVGDADFAFSVKLAELVPGIRIIATTLDSQFA